MKNLRQIVSLVLWLLLGMSVLFNLLFLVGAVGWAWVRIGFAIFMAVLFIVSLLGLILKDIRKEDVVSLNIITPIKEIGAAYIWTLILWVVTNGIVLAFRWQDFEW